MSEIPEEPLVKEEEFKDIPEPKRAHATKVEAEARISQIMIWMANEVRGKHLAKKIMDEWHLSQAMAYDYIRKAQEIELAEVRMSPEQLREFCTRMFFKHAKARDKKISMSAVKELAKHSSYYPSDKLEVTNKFDNLSASDLEKLAQEEGL